MEQRWKKPTLENVGDFSMEYPLGAGAVVRERG